MTVKTMLLDSTRAALSAAMVALCGCTAPTTVDGLTEHKDGVQDHVVGEPTISPSRFQWVELSEDDALFMERTLLGRSGFEFRHTAGPENAAGQRVQTWIDAIHQMVREQFAVRHPGVAFPIPRPEVLLVGDRGVDAWVTHVPVCLDARLELAFVDAEEGEVDLAVVGPSGVVAVEEFGTFTRPGVPRCVQHRHSSELAEFVSYFNDTVVGDCRLELVGDSGDATVVVHGEQCEFAFGRRFHRAAHAAFYATAPRIMVATGMLLEQPDGVSLAGAEEQFVVVLAHELAHYYRAHPVHANRFGFFYELEETPAPNRPTPVADSSQLETQKRRLFDGPPAVRVPRSHFNGRLTAFLTNQMPALLREACGEHSSCVPECEEAANMTEGRFGMSTLASVMRANHRDAYRAYELKLCECARGTRIGRGAVPGSGVMSQESFEQAAAMWWREAELPNTLANLDSALQWINEDANRHDRQVADFLSELRRRNLSVYALEQEADQLSLELLASLGIDPVLAIEKHIFTGLRHQYGGAAEDAFTTEDWVRFQGMDMRECQQLFKRHDLEGSWRDADGNYVFVPIGDLGTPHHGACFRAFDLTREILAHGYEVSSRTIVPSDSSWERVREAAQRLQDRPRPQF